MSKQTLPPSEMLTATRLYLTEHGITMRAKFQFRMSDVQFVEEVPDGDDPFTKKSPKVCVTMVTGQRIYFEGSFAMWSQRNINQEMIQRFNEYMHSNN